MFATINFLISQQRMTLSESHFSFNFIIINIIFNYISIFNIIFNELVATLDLIQFISWKGTLLPCRQVQPQTPTTNRMNLFLFLLFLLFLFLFYAPQRSSRRCWRFSVKKNRRTLPIHQQLHIFSLKICRAMTGPSFTGAHRGTDTILFYNMGSHQLHI